MVSTLYRTNAVICGSSGGRNIAPDQAEQEKEKAYKYPVGSFTYSARKLIKSEPIY